MTSAVASFPPHPLVRAVDGVSAALDEIPESDPAHLSTEEKERVLLTLSQEITRLEALRLRVLAAAGDVAEAHGARHAGAWLAAATRADPATGRAAQRLADRLSRWPSLASAHSVGQATTAQARVVATALEELPAGLRADLREQAEVHLVEQARWHTPGQLRLLGRKVLDVVAPEVAGEHEALLVESEEHRAWDHARVTRRRVGHGLSRAVVTLPDAVMERWWATLHAFASPRRRAAPDDDRPHPRRLAHAFAELLERIPPDWLPQHGGTSTGVLVTIDRRDLDRALATAGTTTGATLSASEARRLACQSSVLPVVLDGAGQPLDLGRAKRLFTSAQRKAMAVRDQVCRAAGCDVPAAWCEAHHLTPWSRGGRTDLREGVLLCSFHHHKAHDSRYDTSRLPNGDLRFHRRT